MEQEWHIALPISSPRRFNNTCSNCKVTGIYINYFDEKNKNLRIEIQSLINNVPLVPLKNHKIKILGGHGETGFINK